MGIDWGGHEHGRRVSHAHAGGENEQENTMVTICLRLWSESAGVFLRVGFPARTRRGRPVGTPEIAGRGQGQK